MIKQIEIKNFKSIESLKLKCKRVNVFIGEPNSGKSNILEALSLFGQNITDQRYFSEIIRMKSTSDLFFNANITNPIEVITNLSKAEIKYAYNSNGAVLNQFHLSYFLPNEDKAKAIHTISPKGDFTGFQGDILSTMIRYYQFNRLKYFQNSFLPHLSPPYGENLPSVLLGNPEIKKWVSDLFRSFGFKLMLWPTENDLTMSKEVNDELYSYPYLTISETLQRLIFIIVAIKSANGATLLFDEPESNTFPMYTKFMAERIANYTSNQFFLTSHNPYLVMSLFEKTPIDDIQIFVTKMKNFKTDIFPINKNKFKLIHELNVDLFFNLDKLISDDKD